MQVSTSLTHFLNSFLSIGSNNGKLNRRSASVEFILENGQIKSRPSSINKNVSVSPRQGVYDAKDIQIDRKVINAIKKRTQAALRQTMQVSQGLKSPRTYKATSPMTSRTKASKTNINGCVAYNKADVQRIKQKASKCRAKENVAQTYDSTNKDRSLKSVKNNSTPSSLRRGNFERNVKAQ